MKNHLKVSILVLAAAFGAAPALAQDTAPKQNTTQPAKTKLDIGDTAPAFKVQKFVKGDAVSGFEKGKVYVVEFWATWCGPCKAAFPHLSEMQKKFGDKVTFIGVNIWERKYSEETLGKIETFVKDQGDKMSYRVAFDGDSKYMDKAFMEASEQDGIPASFIVNQDGKIAWMGHPMMGLEEALDGVLAGKYDLQKAYKERVEQRAEAAAAQASMTQVRKFATSLNKKEYDAAYAMKDSLLSAAGKSAQACNEIAWLVVDPDAKIASDKRNADFALAFANKANELTKGEDPAILDTLARCHWVKGDKAKAIELQKKAVTLAEKSKNQQLDGIKDTLKEYEGGK